MMRGLLLVLLMAPNIARSQPVWELVKEAHDIKVYTAVQHGSAYRRFKATTTMETTMTSLLTVVQDVDSYTRWFAYSKKAELLLDKGDSRYVYMETALPWPFNNEDMIYRLTTHYLSASSVQVDLIGLPEFILPNKGIKRMKNSEGYILIEQNAALVQITYEMHSQPGGDIPAWLVNLHIHELPYRTLEQLRVYVLNN